MKAFEPLVIRNLKLKNRLVMPPMCMYSCDRQDGRVGHFHLAHYGARAIGQVGLIIVEATGVTPEGRITDQCLGLWEEGQVAGMRELALHIKALGAVPALQLIHAGRKSQTRGLRHLAPSAIPYNNHPVDYEEMRQADIDAVVAGFGQAARRAHEAGFEGLELHGAHGYLIHQFLSPLSNRRQDAYGQDRALFLQQVVAAVDQHWPREKALWIRISATDWLEGGVTPADWVNWLQDLPRGMDLVHVSSGGLQRAPVHVYPGYMLPLARQIKEGTGLPVIGVGHLDEDQLLINALENGSCDLVALGRELLRQPNKALALARRLGQTGLVPAQYERAYKETL